MPIDPFFVLIGLTYALTVVYSAAAAATSERHRWLVDVQLACDAVIVSAIVYLTGGVASYFSSLYTLPIIAASTIQSRRGGMMVGVLSSVLYARAGAGAVLRRRASCRSWPTADAAAAAAAGVVHRRPQRVRVLRGRGAERLPGRRAAARRRAAGGASNQLADLQAFNQHVIDSLTSGLATTDIDGRILTFNRAAEAITGVTRGRGASAGRSATCCSCRRDFARPVRRARGPAAAAARRVRLHAAATGGRSSSGSAPRRCITPRGETGFLFTFQDVTDVAKHEREARVQQRLAAVGEMAAGIAHEIRNPLASMSGSIQILRQELPLTDEQAQLMDIVLRESDRLNDTIRSFLAYARPQRLAIDARRRPAGRSPTRRGCCETTPSCSEAHEIDVDVPAEPVWYEADENQIRQIVWNLATNGAARDAERRRAAALASRGARPTRARRRSWSSGVEDQGVGIAPDELDGIFQPFRGAFDRGTGLGLAIVHRIVSDYGGEIQVTSQRGVGTSVEVTLPLRAARRSDAPAVLN